MMAPASRRFVAVVVKWKAGIDEVASINRGASQRIPNGIRL